MWITFRWPDRRKLQLSPSGARTEQRRFSPKTPHSFCKVKRSGAFFLSTLEAGRFLLRPQD